jgi:hypothetical protein
MLHDADMHLLKRRDIVSEFAPVDDAYPLERANINPDLDSHR